MMCDIKPCREKTKITIFFILLLAFALRLWGINFGLPYQYHADEPIVVNHALAYGSGDLNPHFFKVPPFVSYLLFICYGIYFVLLRLSGAIAGKDAFLELFVTDPTSFYLIARIVFGAVIGTFTVYFLYRLCKKHFGKGIALLSSFFLAVNFLHVRDSHYIYTDIPLILILVSAMDLILRISEERNFRHYVKFGFLLGLAVAVKYNGVFLLVPFMFAHVNQKGDRHEICACPLLSFLDSRLKHARLASRTKRVGMTDIINLLIAFIISAVTFFVLNPYVFLDWHFFLAETLGESTVHGFMGWLHHLTYSLHEGVGYLILVFSAAGSILALISKNKKQIIILSFVLAYYAVIVFKGQPYDRYVLPIIPFLLILATLALERIANIVSFPRKRESTDPGAQHIRSGAASLNEGMRSSGTYYEDNNRYGKFVMILIALIIAAPSLVKSILSDRLFAREDVRTEAARWVELNIPADSKIALGAPFFTPRLGMNLKQLIEKMGRLKERRFFSESQKKRLEILIHNQQTSNKPAYELFFLTGRTVGESFLFASPELPYSIDTLRREGVHYVILPAMQPELNKEFRSALTKNALLVKRFSPYKDETIAWAFDHEAMTGGPFLWKELINRTENGQIIEIYRLRDSAILADRTSSTSGSAKIQSLPGTQIP